MALDINQASLDRAALVLIVGFDGLMEWSSDYPAAAVADQLEKIADAIRKEPA